MLNDSNIHLEIFQNFFVQETNVRHFSFINWLPLCSETLRRSNNRNEGSLSIYKWIFWRMFIFETSDVPKKSLLCRTNKYSIEKTFSTCSTSFVFIWLGVVRLKSNKNTHVHMIDARQFKQENGALIENYISFCSCHITTCCYPIDFTFILFGIKNVIYWWICLLHNVSFVRGI